MKNNLKMVMFLAGVFLAFSSAKAQTTSCCGEGKTKTSCNTNCKTSKKENKMTTEKTTCPKCGKDSCDINCDASKTENTSLGGITDDVCSSKTTDQIEREAEAFKKMNVYKKISSVNELETGYEFVYENVDQAFQLELADFLKLEVKCCPTYNYALIVDSENKTVRYQRFGSTQVKHELKEFLMMVGLLKK